MKTLLTGAARRLVQGLGSSEFLFSAAWSTLERKLGQPQLNLSAQVSRIQSYPTMENQDSKSLVEFAAIQSFFLRVLHQFCYNNNFFSSNSLDIVTGKLPLDMRRKWLGIIENSQNRSETPSLMELNTWLQEQVIGMSGY